MSDAPVTTLNCTQCGGELHPQEGEIFLTCPYCSATVYLDKSRVVFHWFLSPTLTPEQAAGELARWMSGNQTVKDLDKKSQVVGQTFQYFPIWFFKVRHADQEVEALQPAAATSITELRRLTLPAGDLKPYDTSIESQSAAPSVPLEAAREWLAQSQPGGQVTEGSLVHVPIYIFKYSYKGNTFTAIVEAGTGMVLANIYPAKAEAPYYTAAGITALVFLTLALLPLSGSPLMSTIALILALIAIPILFFVAVYVAMKV
ncbi:MAG TPA: hypothetical protein VMS73_04895 [Anaerolineaceae bacterium]|nr:hypothetical protein [Anaerolineaceae bacterium]